MMELAEAQFFRHFALCVVEFGAAYRSKEIHGQDEDEQDAVVVTFQAERKLHFDRCFENDMIGYFTEEDEKFKKRAPIVNPRELAAVLKAEAAEMLSSYSQVVLLQRASIDHDGSSVTSISI